MIELHRGACHDNTHTHLFFPTLGDDAAEAQAKRICARCDIRLECLALALKTAHLDGIWGGLTAAERERLTLQHHPSTRERQATRDRPREDGAAAR